MSLSDVCYTRGVYEKDPLVSNAATKIIQIFGEEFIKTDAAWHMVMVFRLPTDEESQKEFASKMDAPKDTWDKIFSKYSGTGKMPDSVKDGITRKQFHDAVFEEIVKIFCGPQNSFDLGVMTSIDDDELFLMMALRDDDAKYAIADMEEVLVKLNNDIYTERGVTVPTDIKSYQGSQAIWKASEERDLDGALVDNRYTEFVSCKKAQSRKFEAFSDLGSIRLIKRRIKRFVDIHSLLDAKICTKQFAVHNWDAGILPLWKKGFNNPARPHWPTENRSDMVNNYFGPEIGFFFHWFNLLTRYLVVPAVLSCGCFILREGWIWKVDIVHLNYVMMGFACILFLWASFFSSLYHQAKNLKKMKWGMANVSESSYEIRKLFDDAYRDTFRDHLQHIFHWCLVIFFVAETLLLVSECARLNMEALQNPDGRTLGISNKDFSGYAKYVITINIKLVDKAWTPLSNMLTHRENWRTVQELQNQIVMKTFLVKMVVFYYPFAYLIVVKPFTRGCGPEQSHTDLTACVDELDKNLFMFFLLQIVTEIVLLILALCMNAWTVRSEKKKNANREYTYLELQAKCAPYGEEEIASDFLNAVISYGYIVLFGVCLPFISFVGFVSNFVMARLIAYKISFAYQRPMPKMIDGIGAWEGVIRALGYLAVPANAYIAIFTLEAFHSQSLTWKLVTFVCVQNIGMAIKLGIEGLIPAKHTAQRRIEEHNIDIMDKIMDEFDPTLAGREKNGVRSPFKEKNS